MWLCTVPGTRSETRVPCQLIPHQPQAPSQARQDLNVVKVLRVTLGPLKTRRAVWQPVGGVPVLSFTVAEAGNLTVVTSQLTGE